MTEKAAKPRVVILGGGIAGIRAARKLANEPVDVLIIDHNNYQVFQPLLYQVATSMLSADEVIYPIRGFFRSASNVNFLLAEIEGIDAAAQTVRTDQGDIGYDHLIIALGSSSSARAPSASKARAASQSSSTTSFKRSTIRSTSARSKSISSAQTPASS